MNLSIIESLESELKEAKAGNLEKEDMKEEIICLKTKRDYLLGRNIVVERSQELHAAYAAAAIEDKEKLKEKLKMRDSYIEDLQKTIDAFIEKIEVLEGEIKEAEA